MMDTFTPERGERRVRRTASVGGAVALAGGVVVVLAVVFTGWESGRLTPGQAALVAGYFVAVTAGTVAGSAAPARWRGAGMYVGSTAGLAAMVFLLVERMPGVPAVIAGGIPVTVALAGVYARAYCPESPIPRLVGGIGCALALPSLGIIVVWAGLGGIAPGLAAILCAPALVPLGLGAMAVVSKDHRPKLRRWALATLALPYGPIVLWPLFLTVIFLALALDAPRPVPIGVCLGPLLLVVPWVLVIALQVMGIVGLGDLLSRAGRSSGPPESAGSTG